MYKVLLSVFFSSSLRFVFLRVSFSLSSSLVYFSQPFSSPSPPSFPFFPLPFYPSLRHLYFLFITSIPLPLHSFPISFSSVLRLLLLYLLPITSIRRLFPVDFCFSLSSSPASASHPFPSPSRPSRNNLPPHVKVDGNFHGVDWRFPESEMPFNKPTSP